MITYSSNDFHNGLKIILENEPYEIESSEFVKPGKGQSFVRLKLRRLLTGSYIEKTFKSSSLVEGADVEELNLTYLYNDGKFWYFMDDKTFDQFSISSKIVGDNAKWLFFQSQCVITIWNKHPISVIPPNFVELKIIDTDPGIKGDTTNTGTKLAIVSTGAKVKVPLFLQNGEIIKIDTRSGKYVSRVR